MEKIIFTCKTITPLVMNGAYGNNNPELRPPGIKASLRFWWRALHGHLPLEDEKEGNSGKVIKKGLRTQESEIFGSTRGRSKVIIRVEENIDENQKSKYSLLPHKGGSEALSFRPENEFKIRIDYNENTISTEKIKSLFILTCTLGGWGKRSRRGFGSVMVTEIDGKEYSSPNTLDGIKEILDKIEPNKFAKNSSSTEIITNHLSTSAQGEYPEIWKIQIGSTAKSLSDIGQATHDTMGSKEPEKTSYKYSVGAGSPRYASPVVISILPTNIPIITTLKSKPPRITKKDENKGARLDINIQQTLKDKIL